MSNSPLAGKPAPESALVDVSKLVRAFYDEHPDPARADEGVAFGTSGHRGSALRRTFNEDHIVAITHAICDYRSASAIDGPLFLGRDTHALSEPASRVACECLAARGVDVRIAEGESFTPTPVVSYAVIAANRGRKDHLADAIVVTPSHNPPEDGGFKYDPPHGGPADTDVTLWIEARANELLRQGVASLAARPLRARAARGARTHPRLRHAVHRRPGERDRPRGRRALGRSPRGRPDGRRERPVLGPDRRALRPEPRGRAARAWTPRSGSSRSITTGRSGPIAPRRTRWPACCRSAIASISRSETTPTPIATASSPAPAVSFPRTTSSRCAPTTSSDRADGPPRASLGKTVVSSSILDRVARARGRALVEVPVGFKWFVSGLADGSMGFAGEESAGASLLRRDGSLVDDGQGRPGPEPAGRGDPRQDPARPRGLLRRPRAKLGSSSYTRLDQPASAAQRARIKAITPEDIRETTLAGDPITARLGEGPRQRRRHRGTEGRHGGGVVRDPPLGHRGRVQALRREPAQPRASRRDRRRSARDRGALDVVGEAAIVPRNGGAPPAAAAPRDGRRILQTG